jgi:enamine deaminase RidA (YjgF/YER057c/UK114 family)
MAKRTQSRRNVLKGLATGAAVGGTGYAAVSRGTTFAQGEARKKVHYKGEKPKKTPLFSSAVSFGNLLFIAGQGAHFDGDIKAHTAHVLDEIEKELKNAGSSMDKALKVQVFLRDLADYKAMNEVFLGRFGPEPPVRTTVACADGIPGDSLVEMDVIAYI